VVVGVVVVVVGVVLVVVGGVVVVAGGVVAVGVGRRCSASTTTRQIAVLVAKRLLAVMRTSAVKGVLRVFAGTNTEISTRRLVPVQRTVLLKGVPCHLNEENVQMVAWLTLAIGRAIPPQLGKAEGELLADDRDGLSLGEDLAAGAGRRSGRTVTMRRPAPAGPGFSAAKGVECPVEETKPNGMTRKAPTSVVLADTLFVSETLPYSETPISAQTAIATDASRFTARHSLRGTETRPSPLKNIGASCRAVRSGQRFSTLRWSRVLATLVATRLVGAWSCASISRLRVSEPTCARLEMSRPASPWYREVANRS